MMSAADYAREVWGRVYDHAAREGITVEPAVDGELRCPKTLENGYTDASPCGGVCVRKAGHEGLCLCAGCEDNIPGTCPA